MIHVRPETDEDVDIIAEINRLAFEGETEVELIKAIRNSSDFISDLSLVAVQDGAVVGHILFSPITIVSVGGKYPALALAPMAVLPEYQRKGIGGELVRRGLEAASESGYKIVIVIGHPEYYSRFGFRPARKYGLDVVFDVPDDAFMALELESGALKNISGVVEYGPAFNIQ